MLAPLSYQVLGWREFNTSFLFIGIAVEVGFTVNNLQLERKSDTLILCQSRCPFQNRFIIFSDHCGVFNFDEAERCVLRQSVAEDGTNDGDCSMLRSDAVCTKHTRK